MGGNLHLQDLAVANDIIASGGTLAASAYDGHNCYSGGTVAEIDSLAAAGFRLINGWGPANVPGIVISGNLSVTGKTSITLNGYYTQNSVVFSFASMTGSMVNLVTVDAAGKVNEKLQLLREDNSIVVSLSGTLRPGELTGEYDDAELNDMLAQTT